MELMAIMSLVRNLERGDDSEAEGQSVQYPQVLATLAPEPVV